MGSYCGLQACACCLSGQWQDVWLWHKAWQKQPKEDSVCSWFQRFQSIIAGRMWWSIIATRNKGDREGSCASQNVVGLHLCVGTIHNQSGPSLLSSHSLEKPVETLLGMGCSVSSVLLNLIKVKKKNQVYPFQRTTRDLTESAATLNFWKDGGVLVMAVI